MFANFKKVFRRLTGIILILMFVYLLGMLTINLLIHFKTEVDDSIGYQNSFEKDGIELKYNAEKEERGLRIKILLENNTNKTVFGKANDSCSNLIFVYSKDIDGNYGLVIDKIFPKSSSGACLAAETNKPLKPGDKDREEVVVTPKQYDARTGELIKAKDGKYEIIMRTTFIEKIIYVNVKDGKIIEIEKK